MVLHAFYQIHCYVPASHLQSVKTALFAAGAGRIGAYESCSWQVEGLGQFQALDQARPFLGSHGSLSLEPEFRLECVCTAEVLEGVLSALVQAHPYETPAYGACPLTTLDPDLEARLKGRGPAGQERSLALPACTPVNSGFSDSGLAFLPETGAGAAAGQPVLQAVRQDLGIYTQARLYDEMHRDFDSDCRFHAILLEDVRGPILELGAGNARVGRHLAAMGHSVWALDLVQPLLDLGEELALSEGVKIRTLCQDMRNFHIPRPDNGGPLLFEAIICPLNTLSHLLTEEDMQACLAAVRRHLAPGGRFVPTMFIPDPAHLDRDPEALRLVDRFFSESRAQEVEVYERNSYHPSSQVNTLHWYFSFQDDDETLEEEFRLRVWYPRELRSQFALAGFRVIQEWEDYQHCLQPGKGGEYSPECQAASIVLDVPALA